MSMTADLEPETHDRLKRAFKRLPANANAELASQIPAISFRRHSDMRRPEVVLTYADGTELASAMTNQEIFTVVETHFTPFPPGQTGQTGKTGPTPALEIPPFLAKSPPSPPSPPPESHVRTAPESREPFHIDSFKLIFWTLIFSLFAVIMALSSWQAAQAETHPTAFVEFAIVTQFERTPTKFGFTETRRKPIEVTFAACEDERDRAQAALQSREIAAAVALEIPLYDAQTQPDGHVPSSYAECIRKRWSVFYRPKITIIEPEPCIVAWQPDFDWPAYLEDGGPCQDPTP
jgi:hypothetical protein